MRWSMLFVVALGAMRLADARALGQPASLIVTNARITTGVDAAPQASALAVRDALFITVGTEEAVEQHRGPETVVINAAGRRVIPGLNDSHMHAVRAGRFYNLELRWDGVRSLARGLDMIREQALRTPEGQWVRVIGGWTHVQFKERRFPTVKELNDAAPDVPVLVTFLYSQGYLNKKGVEALGLTPASAPPTGGRFEFVDGGAILHAEPNPTILYSTIAKLPAMSAEDQVNSTLHFMRELSRFGVTSVVDPGGGGHTYPDDYTASTSVAGRGGIPVRISNYLFTQTPGKEVEEIRKWTAMERLNFNIAAGRLNGFVTEGAGENLVWAAGDFENFMAPRPEFGDMEPTLTEAATLLAEAGWPIRIHATYDQSITRILDVFEPVFKQKGYTARWCIDHAETISPTNITRIKSLGGGIAIQNRMAFAGELFAERYGAEAAAHAPLLRAMIESGVPLGAGTDATRVSSYNPWLSIYWMVSGRTLGGTPLAAEENRLTRREALSLYTFGSAWFSGEEDVKGRIALGQYADFAVLSDDFITVSEAKIKEIESVLTVTGGDIVYAAGPFASLAPSPLPPVSPAWSPVAKFGGYQVHDESAR